MADSEDGANLAVGPAMGPIYTMWENSLEKLKIMNYEIHYCKKLNRKPFNRIEFVLPGNNPSHQFDNFISLCSWLFQDIHLTSSSSSSTTNNKKNTTAANDYFKPEEFDDPNTIINKLMLSLRQIDYKSSFPPQKLKLAYGESVCMVIEYIVDKALQCRGFKWSEPIYAAFVEIEPEEGDDENEDENGEDEILEDEIIGSITNIIDEDIVYEDKDNNKIDLINDNMNHQILQALVDPVEWKTELERVGPKLKSNLQTSVNEWRSHVDQTMNSKNYIEKAMGGDTHGELVSMNKAVTDELNKMRMKEKYMNNQFNTLGLTFIEIKHKLEELEKKGATSHNTVAKYTNELVEITEKLDELKESYESKDVGIHDTSPLIKIKTALQQIKSDIYNFDMRIGVVSNTLLAARIHDHHRLRSKANNNARRRHNKQKQDADDNSLLSGDDE